MMKLKILTILSILLLVAACQKRKYPEDSVLLNPGQIFFNGTVDNQPISLKIGADGYYCYSSYQLLDDSVYVFEGNLRKVNCNPCPLSLQLQLSDYRHLQPGASVLADSSFRTGMRSFIPAVARPATLRFTGYSNKQLSSLHWDLANGFSSKDSIMSYEFAQPGPQTVSLTVRTTGNCESTVINKVYIGGSNGYFACGITTTFVKNDSSVFHSNIYGGTGTLRYTWNFGDGGTSNVPDPTHNYQWPGSYPVKLQVTDAEGHVCESNFIHVTGTDQSSCSAKMSLSYIGSRNAVLSGAKIRWTDQSNVVFSSDSIAQPAESYFEVLSSTPYQANEKGEAGRLLTLRFNVLLTNGSRKIWMKSDNTTIAVAYK